MSGQVWAAAVSADELPALRQQQQVIATRLREGRTVVHVRAAAAPGPQFSPVQATLEDVYFDTLARQRSQAAAVA